MEFHHTLRRKYFWVSRASTKPFIRPALVSNQIRKTRELGHGGINSLFRDFWLPISPERVPFFPVPEAKVFEDFKRPSPSANTLWPLVCSQSSA